MGGFPAEKRYLLQKNVKKCKFGLARCQTPCYIMRMPNKRADNIKRVTVTLDDELLRALEAECSVGNRNRLELIREAIAAYLAKKNTPKPTKESK